jgi:hypothetical protein
LSKRLLPSRTATLVQNGTPAHSIAMLHMCNMDTGDVDTGDVDTDDVDSPDSRAPYVQQHLVFDYLVDEARRQGVCRDA